MHIDDSIFSLIELLFSLHYSEQYFGRKIQKSKRLKTLRVFYMEMSKVLNKFVDVCFINSIPLF